MSGGPDAADCGWRQWACGASTTQRTGHEVVRVALAGDKDEAWREVEAMSPLTLDVLAVMVTRIAHDPLRMRPIRPADVLEAKGCRRQGHERRRLESLVLDEIRRLTLLRVGLYEEALFDVLPVGDLDIYMYRFNPELAAPWGAAGLRPLDRQLVRFDHRRNRGADVLAKKLGMHLSLGCDGSSVRSVRSLLKGMGEGLGSGDHRGRLADRFEEAILRLDESGLFRLRYVDEDAGALAAERTKGWIDRWLDAHLVVAAHHQE